MPADRFASVAREVREAAATAVWIQWRALGGEGAAPREPAAIVDPEALVLASLWMKDEEKRLWDFLYGLAEGGSRLLSVQRLKRLLSVFPESLSPEVARFASAVRHAGNDPRWRGFPRAQAPAAGRPGKWRSPRTRLASGGALMLRLRTAFGVDVRSDTLACLIGRREAWSTVRDIARSLGYARGSVRAACESLTDARLLESAANGRPARRYNGRSVPQRGCPKTWRRAVIGIPQVSTASTCARTALAVQFARSFNASPICAPTRSKLTTTSFAICSARHNR